MDIKKDLEAFKKAKEDKVDGLPTEEEFKKLKAEEAKAFEHFKKHA